MVLAIVPAYNEEKTIGSVVRSLLCHVDRVVVVDDGSLDKTGRLAREAGAVVFCHSLNRGQGAALETGHEYARGIGADFVVHFDADGQFDADDIPPALSALQTSGADILFGSRFLRDCNQSNPHFNASMPFSKKYIFHPIARVVNKFFSTVHLSDAHNGFRILNRRALDAIRITQDRMAHATEIPVLVKKHKLRHIEFPVKVVYREYGQRASGGVEIVKDLVMGKFM